MSKMTTANQPSQENAEAPLHPGACGHDHGEADPHACGEGHNHAHHDSGDGCHHQEPCCHDHGESCGCGQDHSHAHSEGCGCGQDHSHAHGESCGHQHSPSHKHAGGSSCGCAMCQLEDLTGAAQEASSCGCAMCQLEDLSSSQSPEPPQEKGREGLSLPQKLLLTLAVVVGSWLLPLAPQLGQAVLIGTVTLFWGWDLLLGGLKGLLRLRLDENSLMTIAVIAAFVLGEYTEAMMVTILFRLGNILEEKAVKKSRRDIAQVVNIRPQTANRVGPDGRVQVVPSSQLRPGDTILIKVGERVPVDCDILEGETSLDQSAMTGEAVAVGVQAGDRILSGAVNLSNAVTCRAVTSFENSTASRIIKLVEESSAQKGKTERLITRFARVYTPIVVVCALLVALVPPLLGLGDLNTWVMRSLVLLVASCPCALVISVPLALYSGVGAISKQGMLVKGTKFLEPLAKAGTLAFDKTGTVTTGELTLSEEISLDPSQDLLALSALAESYSNHPMARAITGAWEQRGGVLDPSGVEQVQELAGKGVSLLLHGKRLLCGSVRLLEENGIPTQGLPEANVYTALDGRVVGALRLSDRPRPEAAEAIRALKALGVSKTVMLTGDGPLSAQTVQRQCGIDELHAQLLPQDKAALLARYKGNGAPVLFVGDGINDAPVIAAADVGIAMGMGSDAAVESADGVLMSQKLSSLCAAIQTSRRTLGIVRFNIAFILLVKLAVFVLAIFGISNMWMAVFADVGVSILTVLNAVRILQVSPGERAQLR